MESLEEELKQIIMEDLRKWLKQKEHAATAKKKKSKSHGGRKQFVPNTKKARVKTKQESYLEEDIDDTLYE
jgi:hypothetical protein